MTKKLLVLLTALACCTVLFLAACGGDDDDDTDTDGPTAVSQETPDGETPDAGEPTEPPDEGEAPSDGIDACSLLTDEEVTGALGGPSDPPEQSAIGENFNQCLWRIQGGTDFDAAVVVQARPDTSDEDFERLVEENSPEELGPVEPIDGLGDKAYQHDATYVLQGDDMVVVTAVTGAANPEQQQQDLARSAISRLP